MNTTSHLGPLGRALCTICILLLALAGGISSSYAQIIPQPAGLTPGEQYSLVFITADTTNAESTDISTYNTFATNEANQVSALTALNTTWSAIVSTSAVTAISNTGTSGTGVPIYDLEGNEIAASFTQLWSGSLSFPLEYTQTGQETVGGGVWAGTSSTGSQSIGPLGVDFPSLGETGQSSGAWIQSGDAAINTDGYSIYSMSGELTATPEPSAAVLFALALGTVATLRRRHHSTLLRQWARPNATLRQLCRSSLISSRASRAH